MTAAARAATAAALPARSVSKSACQVKDVNLFNACDMAGNSSAALRDLYAMPEVR